MTFGEAAGSPQFHLDNALKNASRVSQEGEQRLGPSNKSKLSFESSSPITHSNESVRRKLRDSLTSALQMAVSKQLMKSVLGVVKHIERTGDGERLSLHVRSIEDMAMTAENMEGKGFRRVCDEDRRFEQRDQPLEVDTDSDDGFGEKEKAVNPDETQVRTISAANHYGLCDLRFEANRSPPKRLKTQGGGRSPVTKEIKGGLQLMERAEMVASKVELNLFSLHEGVSRKYKERARSLLFNLRDKSNPELRARVFEGDISPEALVRMTGEQLASKELSQWRSAKAEELASMVFLRDDDVDPRRIVKKTHKGEFEVVVDDFTFSVSSEDVPSRAAYPVKGKDQGKGNSMFTAVGHSTEKSKCSDNFFEGKVVNTLKCQYSISEEEGEDKAISMLWPPSNFGKNPPETILVEGNTDSYPETGMESADEAPQICTSMHDEPLHAHVVTRGDKIEDKTVASSLGISSERSPPQVCNSPVPRITELGSLMGAYLAGGERDNRPAMWESSVQVSAARFASISGFYRSGERIELKDWPKSLEIKGRVRLGVLDKFLQDLQLSRSRTVTMLSICPSDGQRDVKQMGAYLKEMADQYRIGGRAGFVEPKPGFELYLLAPGSDSEFLTEEVRGIDERYKREDEALIGVLVWRKCQSPIRGTEQNFGVKRVALSSPVSRCSTEVSGSLSPTLCGALPSSLSTTQVTSLVNVSGNSLVHSTQSPDPSVAICGPIVFRDWQQHIIGPELPPKVAIVNRVFEDTYCGVTMSGSQHYLAVGLEDIPPGFPPRSMQLVPKAGSMVLNIGSEECLGDFNAQSFSVGTVSGPVSRVPEGNGKVSKGTAPGFWFRSAAKTPTPMAGRSCFTPQEEEDDLPEFNFEADKVMTQIPENHLSLTNQRGGLAADSWKTIALQSSPGLQHLSDSIGRCGPNYIHDHHLAAVECSASQFDDLCTPTWSVNSVPSMAGRGGGNRMTRSILLQGDSRSLLPLNSIGDSGMAPGMPSQVLGKEKECFNEAQLPLETSTLLSPAFLSDTHDPSLTCCAGHYRHHRLPDLSELSPLALTPCSIPFCPSRGHCSEHVDQQMSPVHMILQYQYPLMNRMGLHGSRCVSLPQQVRHVRRQAMNGTSPYNWQSSDGIQMCHGSMNVHKMAQEIEDKDRIADNDRKIRNRTGIACPGMLFQSCSRERVGEMGSPISHLKE